MKTPIYHHRLSGNSYVADTKNSRIQVFGSTQPDTPPLDTTIISAKDNFAYYSFGSSVIADGAGVNAEALKA